MYPGATGCNTIPNSEDVAPAAGRGARQPSRRGLPQITVRNGFSPSSPALPIRLARNGADTMKLNDLRENWLRSSEERRAALPNRPGPRQPTVASIAERRPCVTQVKRRRTPTPLIPMITALFVQFRTRPESRPQRTNLPNPAQSRTTGASPQPLTPSP